MRKAITALVLACTMIAPAAHARKKPVAAWQVLRATDPVTLTSTCAVVASDYVGRTRFTRIGGLYPVVEMNSTFGLLVGVSSGGQFRLPTGDILWVVDNHPYRELRAADNPGSVAQPAAGLDPAATTEATTAWAMQMARTVTATSTMASGDKAREMLDEMLRGNSLLFRRAAAGPQTGLPDYSALMAGQINGKGELRPIPLDASFREGLTACGIGG